MCIITSLNYYSALICSPLLILSIFLAELVICTADPLRSMQYNNACYICNPNVYRYEKFRYKSYIWNYGI